MQDTNIFVEKIDGTKRQITGLSLISLKRMSCGYLTRMVGSWATIRSRLLYSTLLGNVSIKGDKFFL